MCKGKFDNCYLENPGSDADDHYYDADAENDSDKKDEYYIDDSQKELPVSFYELFQMPEKVKENHINSKWYTGVDTLSLSSKTTEYPSGRSSDRIASKNRIYQKIKRKINDDTKMGKI